MSQYIYVEIEKEITFVNCLIPIKATEVSICSHYHGPDGTILLSDIAKPQQFLNKILPVIGSLPSVKNCYRQLAVQDINQFFIRVVNKDGDSFEPPNKFFVELRFK